MTNPKTPRRMARPAYAPASATDAGSEQADVPNAQPADKSVTKQAQLITLLRADGGATLAAIVEATGWQAHTARAALTGLRQKGHVIVRAKVDGVTRYSIASDATE